MSDEAGKAVLTWQVGEVKITCIVEQTELVRAHRMFAGATQEAFDAIPWLKPSFADDKGRMNFSIQCFVVETPGRRILVDTCIGNDKKRTHHGGMLRTDFLRRFEAAGFSRERIDVVLCTHLHYDHVGWNTMLADGEWVPTFPNARYLMGRAEFEQFKKAVREDDAQIFADSVQPLLDAGLVDLVETDHVLCEEARLTPTPGHTIGHVSVRIFSKGESAFISGDMAHHPCQFAHPDWHNHNEFDAGDAVATRWRVFRECAEEGVLFIGSHFYAPTAGRVVRDGDTWRFEA